MCETVADRFVRPFGGERTEETIIDDENAAIVAVNIGVVAGVVQTMMGRRVEYPFQRPEPTDEFGVQKCLKPQVEDQESQDQARIKPGEH